MATEQTPSNVTKGRESERVKCKLNKKWNRKKKNREFIRK